MRFLWGFGRGGGRTSICICITPSRCISIALACSGAQELLPVMFEDTSGFMRREDITTWQPDGIERVHSFIAFTMLCLSARSTSSLPPSLSLSFYT
jgi:hypothetical protein